jgi:hypothetical protein
MAAPTCGTSTRPAGRGQEQDANFDGKVDAWVALDPRPARSGSSATPPATVLDSVRTNDDAGQPTRLEEDKNGDGKPDHVVTFAAGKPARFEEDLTRTAASTSARA